jgi:hypothetical protein
MLLLLGLEAAGCAPATFETTGPTSLPALEVLPPVGPLPSLLVDDPTRWGAVRPVVVESVSSDSATERWRLRVADAEDALELTRPLVTGAAAREPSLSPGQALRAAVALDGRGFLLRLWRPDPTGVGVLVAAVGVNTALPVDLGELRVEAAAGSEHQLATEAVARLDGCRSVWQHGALAFVWRDGAVWVGPGKSERAGPPEGPRLEVSVHASARPLVEGAGRCRAEARVAWSAVHLD